MRLKIEKRIRVKDDDNVCAYLNKKVQENQLCEYIHSLPWPSTDLPELDSMLAIAGELHCRFQWLEWSLDHLNGRTI